MTSNYVNGGHSQKRQEAKGWVLARQSSKLHKILSTLVVVVWFIHLIYGFLLVSLLKKLICRPTHCGESHTASAFCYKGQTYTHIYSDKVITIASLFHNEKWAKRTKMDQRG